MVSRRSLNLSALPFALAGLVGASWSSDVRAQSDYPTRPIKLVVPFGAGGITDVVARLVAQGLTERLGQSIVVENRPGAGGGLGALAVANSHADGYTLLLGTVGTQVVNKMVYPKISYDPAAFVPISLVSNSPYVLAAARSAGIASLAALIAEAKSKPGNLNFGSAGHGSSPHLGLELLKILAGIDITHVPFKSGGDAVNNALTGQIQLVFDAIPVIMPQVASGGLTALAIAQPTRNPSAAGVPTTAEQGFEGLQIGSWNALLAPAGTPPARASKISEALGLVLADPTVGERLRTLGIEPMPLGPDAYRQHVAAETERWSKVTAAAKISLN
ncbi:MAG: tripartite tricarboxylate transporter substrate binding protein [Proteobacteria bacterium]|nr:tripartite tricarboxylate transporter substrate binding protein [Pseudomonadota bacterium]